MSQPLTPDLFIQLGHQVLLQLHEVLQKEAKDGNVSSECVKSCRHVIMNLRVLYPQVLAIVSERFPERPPSQPAEAKNETASVTSS